MLNKVPSSAVAVMQNMPETSEADQHEQKMKYLGIEGILGVADPKKQKFQGLHLAAVLPELTKSPQQVSRMHSITTLCTLEKGCGCTFEAVLVPSRHLQAALQASKAVQARSEA